MYKFVFVLKAGFDPQQIKIKLGNKCYNIQFIQVYKFTNTIT